MPRARTLAVVVLLLSYGAVGGRQPAVRSSVSLPAPAAVLAETLGLPVAHRHRIVLDVVRLAFDTPDGSDPKDVALRARLNAVLASAAPGEMAPLPLDPSIWREAILRRDIPDGHLLGAILSDRRTALLYHGLASLDDETLGWIGPERELLAYLLQHPGAFAAFASSLKIRGGRVVVPGGREADPIWERVIGASPLQPVAFARRLFGGSGGRLALMYDTVAQLDEPRQRFALALNYPADSRPDRGRALAGVFERSFGELQLEGRPFGRQSVDPAITLAFVQVRPDGTLVGPASRWLWESVFGLDDDVDPVFAAMKTEDARRRPSDAQVDGAWLTARIQRRGPIIARRRLDTLFFAQRVFSETDPSQDAHVVTALRGMLAFPAMMLTLERCGIKSPATLATAALQAHALNSVAREASRRAAITLFQASIGLIDRSAVMGGLTRESVSALVSSLLALDLSREGSLPQYSNWLRRDLLPAMASGGGTSPAETVLLNALSGATNMVGTPQVVEWEGNKYRVSPELSELARLRRVRERQGGATLDDVLAEQPAAGDASGREKGPDDTARAQSIADVLTSILYAVYIGLPDGRILAADNVALRHDLLSRDGGRERPLEAWRFGIEVFRQASGWQLRGSLLGLDVGLGRFALRRIDLTTMPPAPKLTSTERQTAATTVALMHWRKLTDEGRDEIASAIKRGRARFSLLGSDGEGVERIAEEAGLSGWRRESLRWSLQNEPEQLASQISLLELMWLGRPRITERVAIDAWGASALPATGCMCLEMPRRVSWEFLAGRPSVGLLASRGADVALLIAEELAERQLPAALAPSLLAFAMQDALDATQPAYFDDWSEFGRAAQSIPKERFLDYVAALTAGGPLLPLETNNGKRP
jgi:hypothetical protein